MAQVRRNITKAMADDRLQGVMINLPTSIKRKLQQLAQEEAVSLAALVRHQVMDWIAEFEAKQGEIAVPPTEEAATTAKGKRRRGRPKGSGTGAMRYKNFALPRLRELEHAEN